MKSREGLNEKREPSTERVGGTGRDVVVCVDVCVCTRKSVGFNILEITPFTKYNQRYY